MNIVHFDSLKHAEQRGLAEPVLSYFDKDDSHSGVYRKAEKLTLTRLFTGLLTDKQLNCYIKHFVHGKKVAEIANEMGVKPTTVYKHIKITKKKIADIIALAYPDAGIEALIGQFETIMQFLPLKEKELAVQYYLQSRSLILIAGAMKKPYGTVADIYERAKRCLKKHGLSDIDLQRIRDYFKEQNSITTMKGE